MLINRNKNKTRLINVDKSIEIKIPYLKDRSLDVIIIFEILKFLQIVLENEYLVNKIEVKDKYRIAKTKIKVNLIFV